MGAADSIEMSAGDYLSVAVGSNVVVQSGGSLTGHVADHVDVAAGSVQASSAGTVSVMSGDDLSVSAEGDMVGVSSGSIDVGS